MHEMTEQSVTVKCWLSNSESPSGYTFFLWPPSILMTQEERNKENVNPLIMWTSQTTREEKRWFLMSSRLSYFLETPFLQLQYNRKKAYVHYSAFRFCPYLIRVSLFKNRRIIYDLKLQKTLLSVIYKHIFLQHHQKYQLRNLFIFEFID